MIDGKNIGCITIRGTVTIRNSKISCPGAIAVEVDGSGNLTIEDTEITCVTGTGTGIDRSSNGQFTGRRLYIHSCENGLHMESNTRIEDSFIAVQTIGGAHADGIQGVSGSNIVIKHNTIMPDSYNSPGSTSSIIFAGQTMPGLIIQDNLLSSGQYTLYCPPGGSGIVISGNRFQAPLRSTITSTVGTVYGANYGLTDGCARSGIAWTNNVRDDTGALIPA